MADPGHSQSSETDESPKQVLSQDQNQSNQPLVKTSETPGETADSENDALLSKNPSQPPLDQAENDANRISPLKGGQPEDSVDAKQPTEATPLLGQAGHSQDPSAEVPTTLEENVIGGDVTTSWAREAVVLARFSLPLITTFFLQQSLTLTSILTVGRMGKIQLGAVSLGTMTASITGYGAYYGLATALDTLCPQAYGSGRKDLVGLHIQRMVLFLWVVTIPIACLWATSTQILSRIVPDQEIAVLSGQYLRILILGAPAFSAFESGKRYVQAQGRFDVTLYVLLVAAPLNVFLHWLFVWHFQWGFIGCPLAVVTVENTMPFLLIMFVRLSKNLGECWPGLSYKAWQNWGPMIRLAVPGMVMVMAEMLAFELLTLGSARLGATQLAAQSILSSLTVSTFCLPFSLSIATSTRLANLIGAALPDAAKRTARVTFTIGGALGLFNMLVLSLGRNHIPFLFTADLDVVRTAARTLPVNAAFQLFDAFAAQANGVLRGVGKQKIGSYVSLFAYYVFAMPISFGTAFGLNWGLYGLWCGPACGLAFVSISEGLYISRMSWNKAVEDAARRSATA